MRRASPVNPPRAVRDALHYGLFHVVGSLGASARTAALRAYFGWKFRQRDPWHYESSEYEQRKYDQIIAAIPDRPFERALEVGCAEGHFTRRLSERAHIASITGVDISARAVERAAASAPARTTFLALDIVRESPPGMFDLVLCAELLYYLGPAARILADRIELLLRPGGTLILAHPLPHATDLHRPFVERERFRMERHVVTEDSIRPIELLTLRG